MCSCWRCRYAGILIASRRETRVKQMLAPNTLLQNRYLIVRLIAQGGMGAVYEARHKQLKNTVAVKQTLAPDDILRRALEREARLLANLRHQALPKVIDHFTEGDSQFLVMEFIDGPDFYEMRASETKVTTDFTVSSPFDYKGGKNSGSVGKMLGARFLT